MERGKGVLIPRCSALTLPSVYHFHFRAPFFNLQGAKCVPVKELQRAFVTAILESEEQSNTALQSPLHCPCFIKTINLDVKWKVVARECLLSSVMKKGLFSHQLQWCYTSRALNVMSVTAACFPYSAHTFTKYRSMLFHTTFIDFWEHNFDILPCKVCKRLVKSGFFFTNCPTLSFKLCFFL